MDRSGATLRLDKWLWQARFFKTRGLATDTVAQGSVRVNGQRAGKPAHAIRAGDTLTFPQGNRIRVIRVVALSFRRGSAAEAHVLYLDLDAPPPPDPDSAPAPLE